MNKLSYDWDWKPVSPEHAVKCLESWVEQGKRINSEILAVHGMGTVAQVKIRVSMARALIEGMKPLLEEWHRLEKIRTRISGIHGRNLTPHGESWQMAIGFVLVEQVAAYTLWMVEAGMTIPEP